MLLDPFGSSLPHLHIRTNRMQYTRQPSTPPPLEDEPSNPFFATPQVNTTSKSLQSSDSCTTNQCIGEGGSNNATSLGVKSRKKEKHNAVLFTPQTPYLPNNDEYPTNLLPMSPQTTTKKSYQFTDIISRQQQHKHFDPLRTPETTPRHFHRKRDISDSICLEGHSRLNYPLFPSTQPTVGTGRRVKEHLRTPSNNSDYARDGVLEFGSAFKISVEEEEEDEDNEEQKREAISPNEHVSAKYNKLVRKVDFSGSECNYEDKERALMNYTSSECDSDEESTRTIKMNILKRKLAIPSEDTYENKTLGNLPVTPPNQLIDDNYIDNIGIEKNRFFQSNDLAETVRDLNKRFKIDRSSNPFIQGKDEFQTVTHDKGFRPNPRYENEIEMVYHATGEKFFVPLSEEGKKFKPKRLNFGEFQGLGMLGTGSKDTADDLPATPVQRNKMSIERLLNREARDADASSWDDSIAHGVRHEKISNPFVGDFPTRKQESKHGSGVGKEGVKIDYINQSTGQHIVENMDEEQLMIKPRKLNFDGC